MERGPMALFGAIVAVGLGPAMWLGAQFGNAIETPNRPPAVTSEQGPTQRSQDKGGEAGSAPEDSTVVETDPRADVKPLPEPSSKQPARHSSSKPTKPSAGPSSSDPSSQPSSASSAPTESTPSPTPSDGSGEPDPPSPPADSGPDQETGSGSIAAGSGLPFG